MEPNDFRYLFCIQEYGLDEVVFQSPERMATFQLVLAHCLMQGFGALAAEGQQV